MTKEEILRMAQEANLPACHLTHPKALERFAILVAKQERERIAKKIEQLPFGDTAASFGVYVREL